MRVINIDSNAKAIAANSAAIAEVRNTLTEAAGRTLRAVDELREVVEEERVNFREHLKRTDTAIAGICFAPLKGGNERKA